MENLPNTNSRPKFSFIGTGFIMPRHAEAVDYINGEVLDFVNESQGPEAWREVIKNPRTDYVCILAPNDLHYEMAVESLKLGKTVLCEKPLTIKSSEARSLQDLGKVFVVLQLRHHPLVKELREKIRGGKFYNIEMDISVYRDEEYYAGWKGMSNRSGGVLFNLGIHYFDLLMYLFGDPHRVSTISLDEKTGSGELEGSNFLCKWRVSTGERQDNQRRTFKIDGSEYNFSSKDNLSYENLHRFVYEDLLNNKGVGPAEAAKSIELVEKLYESHNA